MSNLNIPNGYIPPADLDSLVLTWLKRCRESQFAHYEVAAKYASYHKKLGIPTIAVAALVSCSVFAVLKQNAGDLMKVAATSLSLLSVLLTSLQTFLKFSETSAAHNATAAEYSSIRRELEVIHATHEPKDPSVVSEMGKRISEIASKAPNISKKVFDEIQNDVGN
jgi:hypothetical protein